MSTVTSKVFQLFSSHKDKNKVESNKPKKRLAKSQSCEIVSTTKSSPNSSSLKLHSTKHKSASSIDGSNSSNTISGLSLSPSISSISTASSNIDSSSNTTTTTATTNTTTTPIITSRSEFDLSPSNSSSSLNSIDTVIINNNIINNNIINKNAGNTFIDNNRISLDKLSPSNSSDLLNNGGGLGSRRSWPEQLDHEKDQFVDEVTHSDSTSILSHPSFLEPSRVQRIKVSNLVIIYNPHSGSRIGEKIMSEAKKYFENHSVTVQTIPTEYKGHAEDLCRTIDISEIDVVCLVGGDGTIHEAVNGIMKRDQESREKFVLACIPAGTGNSFVLELQGKISIKYQCERVLNGLTVPIDIAKVSVIKKDTLAQECNRRRLEFQVLKKKYGHLSTFNDEDQVHNLSSSQEAGRNSMLSLKQVRPDALMEFAQQQQVIATADVIDQPEVFYSFNSIHWGLGSKINITAEKMRWMGKAVRYTTAALFELFKGEKILARVEYEDANGEVSAIEDEFCLAIVNNIQGAAKGMKMAPKAKLNDGLFDLLLIKSHKTFDLMNIFTKVYDGTHTELNYVIYKQVKRFSITPFKRDKERKKRLRKEKKRIRAAIKAGKDHLKNPLEILKTECNTILSELEDQIDEEIIDIDGELKGATPFFCEVIPRSIRVVV